MKLYQKDVLERIKALEIPFNKYGLDHFGVSQEHLASFFTLVKMVYRNYLSVSSHGMENIPTRGRVMLVGNHSGGVAMDAGMVLGSLMFDMDPPRLAHGMAEKFLNRTPFASKWLSRVGQFTGLPEHAVQLLEDERALMVFPEGAKGTAKLYSERYALVKFGTGFMRLALQTKTPIVPFGFLGGGEVIPTVMNLYSIGKLLGVPYVPVTPYIFPIPRPVPCQLYYGEPLYFEGNGNEDDETIEHYVSIVKESIAALILKGWSDRKESGTPPGLEAYLEENPYPQLSQQAKSSMEPVSQGETELSEPTERIPRASERTNSTVYM